jgi:hypothetical protein
MFARAGSQLAGNRPQPPRAIGRQVSTFGQVLTIMPLMFSLLPRGNGPCGSQNRKAQVLHSASATVLPSLYF